MPQAPMLQSAMMQQQQQATGNPLNFLIAAADMHNSGQLATPQRSMPKGQSMNLPTTAKRERKNIRIIK